MVPNTGVNLDPFDVITEGITGDQTSHWNTLPYPFHPNKEKVETGPFPRSKDQKFYHSRTQTFRETPTNNFLSHGLQ